MGKGSHRGRFWRGVVLEGLAVIAVVLLVTSGRLHTLESASAESLDPLSTAAVAGEPASSDAVERELRRAGARLQQWIGRHLQSVREDLWQDRAAAERQAHHQPRTSYER